ncbi:MAG: hypothetical protein KF819_10135 [Labilithrix sp.]|nr:hypothetical protein [Labilithrix sp.]
MALYLLVGPRRSSPARSRADRDVTREAATPLDGEAAIPVSACRRHVGVSADAKPTLRLCPEEQRRLLALAFDDDRSQRETLRLTPI